MMEFWAGAWVFATMAIGCFVEAMLGVFVLGIVIDLVRYFTEPKPAESGPWGKRR